MAQTRPRASTLVLSILLALAIAAIIWLYPRATRPLYDDQDEALIETAVQHSAREFRSSPGEVRRYTFPIVMRLAGETCVELRSTLRERAGNHVICFKSDPAGDSFRVGAITQERTIGEPFP